MNKHIVIRYLVILTGIIYIAQLAKIQLFDKSYREAAINNIIRKKNILSYRGLIKDRNNTTIAYNIPVYDLYISMNDFKEINTKKLCNDLNLGDLDIKKYYNRTKKNTNKRQPTLLLKNLSIEQWGKFQEKIDSYRGISVEVRTKRELISNSLAHVVGHLNKPNRTNVKQNKNLEYSIDDFVGVSGLENFYEEVLRGECGTNYKLVTANGLEDFYSHYDKYDTKPINGKTLYTCIDLELQDYAYKLLEGKIGSIVAIEPATGEVLAIACSPIYQNPSNKYFYDLGNSSHLNRAIMSAYPPGSIFKLMNGLFALVKKKVNYDTVFPCDKIVKCHEHPANLNFKKAIQYSCNPYFTHVFFRIFQNEKIYVSLSNRLDDWTTFMKKFSLGVPLGIDLPMENSGFIPDSKFYDKLYGKKKWNLSRIRSLDIGQGEILVTPLQLANFAAIIANRGYYITPHIVKKIDQAPCVFRKFYIDINSEYFDFFLEAMQSAVESGTCHRAFIKDLEICGKTGTSQNNSTQDHSVCILIAPKQNPKIVVSVYIENAGWGARAAAAMAGLVVEKYLMKKISRKNLENYVIAGNFD